MPSVEAVHEPFLRDLFLRSAGNSVSRLLMGGVSAPGMGFVGAQMMQHADSGDGWQGKYKDDGANDTLMTASYIGREWSNLAPFDANAPGGAS